MRKFVVLSVLGHFVLFFFATPQGDEFLAKSVTLGEKKQRLQHHPETQRSDGEKVGGNT